MSTSNGTSNGDTPVPADGETPKTEEKLASTQLISAITWDVFTPPPTNTIKGKIVPAALTRRQTRRKISLEVHKVTPLMEDEPSGVVAKLSKKGQHHSYEECVVRMLVPKDKKKRAQFMKEAKRNRKEANSSNDTFVDGMEDIGYDDDDASVDMGALLGKKAAVLTDTGGKQFDGWSPRYRIPCPNLTVKSQQAHTVHVMVNIDKLKQERVFIFDTLGDATSFCETLERERKQEMIRSESRLKWALRGITLPPNETLNLLVEIVSGWNLPIGDMTSSDPFVTCMIGRKEVHRTKHKSSTLNPIWTVKTGGLFVLTIESRELFIEEGMKLLVKDFDQFGSNETLGIVNVPPGKIYQSNGERLEFKLKPVPGHTDKKVPGYLAVRFRRASDYDQTFMEGYNKAANAIVAPTIPKVSNPIKTLVQRNHKKDHGEPIIRVRPHPDPTRKEETTWMNEAQIEEEAMKPSMNWTDAGSGNLGKIHLEILGCDDLPNLDAGGFLGNKTDTFVSIVYGDTFVRTNVIDDCLSPRWLPWTDRAFTFNISHPSSEINLGVFDFDTGLDDHDLIGRVAVDVTNLRKDTEYLLTYNIYPSAQLNDREAQGRINIRLRLEIPNERKLVLTSLQPPPPDYVNVKGRKDFRIIRNTCNGTFDADKYAISTIKSYADELRELQHMLFYLEDALMTLILWRGHFALSLFGKDLLLPVHSFNAFVIAITLVEFPQYYPSFCFASVAWFLIAVMGWKNSDPDPWGGCFSYYQILEKLVLGTTTSGPSEIKPLQNLEQTTAKVEEWMNRLKAAEKKAEEAAKEAEEAEKERLKELEEIGDADGDLSTKTGKGITIDPIKVALHPVQLILGSILMVLRFVKNVIYWEEAYLAFWIATGSLLLSFVCLFVPWFFLIKWTSRIFVWTIFGPWMKLVDVFYVSTLKPETDEERKAREVRQKLERKLATTKAASHARQVREHTAKMKDMKVFMFGKFAMSVPIFKQYRYHDRPLAQSSATAYNKKSMSLTEVAMQEAGYHRTLRPGQTLVGEMVPKVEKQSFTAAPMGVATGQTGSQSTSSAYAKIGGIAVVAGIVTIFLVPYLANMFAGKVDIVEETSKASGMMTMFRISSK